MATFADMATLLLTFFVLMLSFANTDVKNFRTALGSVKEALGVQFAHPGDKMGLTTSIVELGKEESTASLDLNIAEIDLVIKIKGFLKSAGVESQISADTTERGIVLRVKEKVLFPAGKATLMPGSEKPLKAVGTVAKTLKQPIWIEGHTDNKPINTRQYPSNWELSSSRAIAALRYLEKEGGVSRLQVRVGGYADTMPIATNETKLGRARNRRVEFVFIRPTVKDKVDEKKVAKSARRAAAELAKMSGADTSSAAPGGKQKTQATE